MGSISHLDEIRAVVERSKKLRLSDREFVDVFAMIEAEAEFIFERWCQAMPTPDDGERLRAIRLAHKR